MKTYKTFFQENYIEKRVPANNRKGYKIEYEYTGLWYGWEIPDYRRARLLYGALGALNAVVFAVCGTRGQPVNYLLAVETLALLSVIPLLFELIGLAQFCAGGNSATEFAFREMKRRLRVMPVLHAGLLVLAAAVGAVYCAAGTFPAGAYLVLGGYLLCAGLSAFIAVSFQRFRVVSGKTTC